MKLNAEEQKFTINNLIGQKTKNVFIEGNIIIPDVKPDILRTIDSTGNICIYKKDVMDGKVKIDGGINLYLIYLPDSDVDTQRGINTTLDFSQLIEVEECKSNMDMNSVFKIKQIECNVLNGRKVKVKVEMEIIIQIYSREEINFFSDVGNINNIQMLKEQMQINTLIGCGEAKLNARDTIAYTGAENLVEILKVNLNIVNKETKISFNKVLIKADLNVKIIYLTDIGEVNVLNSNIPVIGFVDIPNVIDENIVITSYEIRNMLIKPKLGNEHTIDLDIEVGAYCSAYGIANLELIQDMYSTEENIEFTTNNIEIESNKCVRKTIFNINESISIPEISNNKIYDVDIKPVLNNVNILNKKIIYEGEIILKFLFDSNMNSGIEVKRYVCPFNFEMEDDCIKNSQKVDTEIECLSGDYTIISDGNIDCKIDLQFNTEISDIQQIRLIDKINVSNELGESNCNMVIHRIKQGDTLWNIAKKYKTTVENIIKINSLEDDNLNIGKKIYIQRNSNNKKSIA